eukprot:Gb_01459 [translate_table: standard]
MGRLSAHLVIIVAASVSISLSILYLNFAFSPSKVSVGIVKHAAKLAIQSGTENVTSCYPGQSCRMKRPSAQLVKNNNACDQVINIVVDQLGFGNYTTLQEAVDWVPDDNKQRIIIHIKAGTYLEKIYIGERKANITLQGEGAESTHIAWNDTVATAGSTKASSSFTIAAPDFIAKDISFHNIAYPPRGSIGAQAVAVAISGDRAAFYRCKFYAYQDTLLDEYGRHYFKQCFIEGSVDFIFGFGQSLYEECEIHSIADKSSGPVTGAITAQGRKSAAEKTGFSFVNCSITGTGRIFLGRAWGTSSRVVFCYTEMEDIIAPEGWSDWGDPTRKEHVFYGQYKCRGPGADLSRRVKWSRELQDDEAALFLHTAFIDGDQWLNSQECNTNRNTSNNRESPTFALVK